MGEQPTQRRRGQRHTACGWGKARAGNVDEHGAATAGDARPRVVVELDDQIVKLVQALETVAGSVGIAPDRLVVVAIPGVFAPGVIAADTPDRQLGHWPSHPVGAPPQPPQPERAARGAAVTLALVGPNAAATERDRQCKGAGGQNAAGSRAGLGANAKRRK